LSGSSGFRCHVRFFRTNRLEEARTRAASFPTSASLAFAWNEGLRDPRPSGGVEEGWHSHLVAQLQHAVDKSLLGVAGKLPTQGVERFGPGGTGSLSS
jgi:hypothetical protein